MSTTAPITKIDPEVVNKVFLDCLFRSEELDGENNVPANAVIVEGVLGKFGFHSERLQSHADEVRAWLSLLPHQFRKSSGGGWSFLNACNQEDGEQWTDFHRRMDQLFTLGIALGLAKFQMPREMWDMFPGGMPYIEVSL